MYPWYRTGAESQSAVQAMQASSAAALGQFCPPMGTTIKTENGYTDCMLAIDYAATQPKKSFVGWDSQQNTSPGPNQQCSQPNSDCTLASPTSVQCLPPGANNSSGGATGASGGGGGNPSSLAHWMSVMAEHMGHVSATDPAAVGVHYMAAWSQQNQECGQHPKEEYGNWPSRNHMLKQGYEAKMPTDHLSTKGNSATSHHNGASNGLTQGPNSGNVQRKYQCKMCPQSRGGRRRSSDTAQQQSWESEVFGSKADLQLHTQMHMREAKPYKCSQCCKAFANSSYLSQHTRIHLGIKPYRCEICQRKFTQLSHLQQHIRTHTGDKPYKCRHPGCQKAFSQLSNLQSHSRCHQTDKPYKCNSCYKCFTDEQSLLEHIPKHKESKHLKTHICQFCGKSYTQETYLQKHMQKHSERDNKRGAAAALHGPLAGLNRNLLAAVGAAGVGSLESPYWSKLSPDTMSNLDLERIEYHNHHAGGLASNAAALLLERNAGGNLGLLDRNQTGGGNVQNMTSHLEANHRNGNYGTQPPVNGRQSVDNFATAAARQSSEPAGADLGPDRNATFEHTNALKIPDRNNSNSENQQNNHNGDIGEDLVINRQQCRVNSPSSNENSSIVSNNLGNNTSQQNGGATTPYTDASKSGYEISLSRSVANSAFTPISGINHLNNLNLNHHMARPYLYDTLSFQNKDFNLNLNKGAAGMAANNAAAAAAFPNQLISLHQIRNYAHQPNAPGVGAGGADHLMGLKEK